MLAGSKCAPLLLLTALLLLLLTVLLHQLAVPPLERSGTAAAMLQTDMAVAHLAHLHAVRRCVARSGSRCWRRLFSVRCRRASHVASAAQVHLEDGRDVQARLLLDMADSRFLQSMQLFDESIKLQARPHASAYASVVCRAHAVSQLHE